MANIVWSWRLFTGGGGIGHLFPNLKIAKISGSENNDIRIHT